MYSVLCVQSVLAHSFKTVAVDSGLSGSLNEFAFTTTSVIAVGSAINMIDCSHSQL